MSRGAFVITLVGTILYLEYVPKQYHYWLLYFSLFLMFIWALLILAYLMFPTLGEIIWDYLKFMSKRKKAKRQQLKAKLSKEQSNI